MAKRLQKDERTYEKYIEAKATMYLAKQSLVDIMRLLSPDNSDYLYKASEMLRNIDLNLLDSAMYKDFDSETANNSQEVRRKLAEMWQEKHSEITKEFLLKLTN